MKQRGMREKERASLTRPAPPPPLHPLPALLPAWLLLLLLLLLEGN